MQRGSAQESSLYIFAAEAYETCRNKSRSFNWLPLQELLPLGINASILTLFCRTI
ncbi:hypothetical protein CANTEDRAFT_114288 [Yamadazyma tenuis ATCC 10573]|uniref:Uncharacterized protein n=1 Tax=Candida tenuis (strain ATCC 10573 / BCRC 21748 / CBS 615 / JCM 9827 / NBRC 10315 / NRRL Y-1498 / VKM Y-70) TaxID=590646 RepID=G3B6M3_CANTC|nr:uncharacterized protein CANTEDRAFT_114288 [Yamadazyma tenuis ATCC 10573]EGV62968.1 hypothetical protein CANTEDRAFT_114288 [Yamadazyma tenuis ATCC 10573]